jgi:hypothetical protein
MGSHPHAADPRLVLHLIKFTEKAGNQSIDSQKMIATLLNNGTYVPRAAAEGHTGICSRPLISLSTALLQILRWNIN